MEEYIKEEIKNVLDVTWEELEFILSDLKDTAGCDVFYKTEEQILEFHRKLSDKLNTLISYSLDSQETVLMDSVNERDYYCYNCGSRNVDYF